MKYRYFCSDCSQGTNTARRALGDHGHNTLDIKTTKVEVFEASDTRLCMHKHCDDDRQCSPSSGAPRGHGGGPRRAALLWCTAEPSLPSSTLLGTSWHTELCFHLFCTAGTKTLMLSKTTLLRLLLQYSTCSYCHTQLFRALN